MIRGAWSLLDGMRLLLMERKLRAVLWRILAMLTLLLVVVIGGVYWLTGWLAAMWIPGGDAWYWELLGWLMWFFAFAIAVITGMVSFATLGSAAAAPWLDTLAARAEGLVGVPLQVSEAPWTTQVVQSLLNSLRPLLGLIPYAATALLLLWIPVIGQLLAAAIWGYGGIRFLNFELMDVPASRRNWNFRRRKVELGERRWHYLAFGGTAMALMLVPLVNLLVVPAAVVALSRSLRQQ